MPGKVKVKILAGRNLPVMDRSGDTTDAFVEIKFGTTTYKTDVCRKSLNPQWNSEWYKFEVDDAELQDEPLQIRLMDHDTYSANDAIGKVYLNLNPLLLPGVPIPVKNIWTLEASMNSILGSQGGSVMNGWIPVFDTMHGIRGEVNIIVKVELFLDFNKFRQSSCGVQFFYSSNVPHGYHAQVIHGFVEELIYSDDPEYKWIDKIRTPRASNEARQTLFFKLSGEVQRKIGLKALDLGGNAVIGYTQNFDLEGEPGIVARGTGTAVTLVKLHDFPGFLSESSAVDEQLENQKDEQQPGSPPATAPPVPSTKNINSPAIKSQQPLPLCRRSSDSDLSITPKGNSLTGSDRSMGGYLKPTTAVVRTMNQDSLEMLEYPFITMQQFPPGFLLHIGGLVSAKSVKLLEKLSNLDEPESRDAWWTEIRMEVRSHARALACNVVIGYREETSICEDICVLSASGTAAVINLNNTNLDQEAPTMARSQIIVPNDSEKVEKILTKNVNAGELLSNQNTGKTISESNDNEIPYILPPSSCSICHLPYNKSSINFQVNISKCGICQRAKVPDVLFTTFELPDGIPVTGRGSFIHALVCKTKRDLRGELNAKEISDCLPFLEYELHSLLLNKLKVRGMNAVFGLRIQVSVGEKLIIGMAVGTAVFLSALPVPSLPRISGSNSYHNENQLAEIQKNLQEVLRRNREYYQLKSTTDSENGRSATSDTDESEDDLPEIDLGLGMKDVCILEVDDLEDMDRISLLLLDETPPVDFHVVNTETIPGLEDLEIVRNLQMFTQVSRAKISSSQLGSMPSKYFTRLLQTVYFKLRRMIPVALCDLQFKMALPEQDEIQLSVIGIALGLGEAAKLDDDMIFSLEEDHNENANVGNSTPNTPNTPITPVTPNTQSAVLATSVQKQRPRSPLRIKTNTLHRHKHVPLKERYGVDITPLCYLPGGKIDRYLGNLNFFFIRECNSIRESGGLSGFVHSFVTEVLAIVRAHVTALGGNAMVAFFLTQCVLLHNPHKNQGQCLINVGGDVVSVSYFGNDKQPSSAASGNG